MVIGDVAVDPEEDRIEVDAAKQNPAVDRSRTQRQFNLGAGVHADADGFDRFFNCALFQHRDIISS